MSEVRRTERGWGGHFICAYRCLFRRNTLLELGEIRIVISTVGAMLKDLNPSHGFETVGWNRHYETMVFPAHWAEGRYWDADVMRGEISFESNWSIDVIDADDRANDMHEQVVSEFIERLNNGETFPAYTEEVPA